MTYTVGCTCKTGSSAHSEDLVDEAPNRPEDRTAMTSLELPDLSVHGYGVYAMIELGVKSPKYRQDKIRSYLYTASNDVRRAEDGSYVLKRRPESMGARKDAVDSTSSSSSSATPISSGGPMRRLRRAIEKVWNWKHYGRSKAGFRELKDCGSSVTASGFT